MAATEVVEHRSLIQRTRIFYDEVVAEMKRVTWPDLPQIRQLSIGVIALSLFIGGIIWLMDVVLQQVLVRWLPAIFGS